MKNFIGSALLLSMLSPAAFSQQTQSAESQKLSQQVFALYQQRKLDEAIPLAEKALEIERKFPSKNYEKIASAMLNLAVLRKERMRKYTALSKYYDYDAEKNLVTPIKEAGSFQTAFEDFQTAEKLFREVIKLGKKEVKQESAQIATALNELAWLLQNGYQIQLPRSEQNFEEVENLYRQALALRENLFGKEDDVTLITVLQLAELYAGQANFEEALKLYERHISAMEKKYGNDHKNLVSPLVAYARVLSSTDREDAAQETVRRAASIAGQEIELPPANFNLFLRTNDWKKKGINSSTVNFSQEPMKKIDAAAGSLSSTSYRIVGSKSELARINVKVVVDETGKVLTAAAQTVDEKLKSNIEKEVLKWKFKPFAYNGEGRKMKGFVVYFQKQSKLFQTRN